MLLNLYLFTSVQVKLSSLSFAYMNRQLMKQSLFTIYVHSSSGTALGDGQVPLTPIASDPVCHYLHRFGSNQNLMQGTTKSKSKEMLGQTGLDKRSEKFQH